MLILITNGTYGHSPMLPDGRKSPYVVPVNRKNGPIDVESEEAARLVEEGIAEYVTGETAGKPQIAEEKPEGEALKNETPLEEMTFAQLKEIAKGMGIDVGKIKSKAALIEALSADAGEGEDAEALPDLDAQDVVD